MIHRTFRSLDQAPKLVAFTIGQWLALITDSAAVLALVLLTRMPVKPAISLCVFTIGLPAALMYVSEAGGLRLGALLADACRWRLARRCDPARLLGVAAIEPDGVVIRTDGVYVRLLEVGSVNPLVLEAQECDRISAAFAQIAARLPDRQCLQVYVQGEPLDLDALLAEESFGCEQAAGAAEEHGENERAMAIRRLGGAQEQSIRTTAEAIAPVTVRFLVVCPWRPDGLPFRLGSRRPVRVRPDVHEKALRDSLRHLEGIAGELDALGLPARTLTGGQLLDLLHSRLDPDAQETGAPPVSFMHPELLDAVESAAGDGDAAQALADAICTAPLSFADRSHVRIGQCAERFSCVTLSPEQTWLGWLLALMQSPRPFCLSVHVQATERYRERMAQRRRFKRIYGANRGVEQRGKPLDPDAALAEQEASELTDELATSAGSGIYRVSIYAGLREPGPDPDVEALGELCEAAGRELTMACDARLSNGVFAQRRLWASTLPLGRDVAARRRRYVSRNVGDSFPLTGTHCGSEHGIPLGYAIPGRTLVRLDPFDPAHPNHLLLVNGMSGAGKTMASIILLSRAISQGACGFIVDRAGHFDFLASLIPGAASLRIGADAHAINAWDVPDPARVPAEKIDYLLALHALLLGEHHQASDSYGLTDLESNLLGLAIGEVYARCALTGEVPRELLLQEELERRYETERAEGSVGIAEALRNLSMRINNYVAEGPYSYLTDRPTTIPAGAPLVVFDTRSIPDAKAAAALFVICEHVRRQIEQTRTAHLAGEGPAHSWSGRSFLVVDEAWKLIERPATGRWFNEFVRRSRHYALWLVAISQQLSDFDNEHGRALIANASMQLFLRQQAKELAYVKTAAGLSGEAVAAIGQLQTIRGRFSTAYLVNGSRGQGVVQIGVGPTEYWIAATDPARDEHVLRRALRQADGDAWAALELLADEDWQRQLAEHLGMTA